MSNRELIDEAREWTEKDCQRMPISTFDLIERLSAALEAQEWQPIETAPKDAVILAFNPMVGIYTTQYAGGEWPLRGLVPNLPCSCIWYPRPTHWRPLPPAPETEV